MAALDLASPPILPYFPPLVTLSATPGLMRRVNLPAGHGGMWLSFFPLATDAKLVTLAVLVADDTTIGANGWGPLPYGQWSREFIPRGVDVFYVASATASQQVHISPNCGVQS